MMPIDTETRHVTAAGANIFLDLGFPRPVAERLLRASRAQIEKARSVPAKRKKCGPRAWIDRIGADRPVR